MKAGLSIEDLAEDIYRRTLLQSLNVRAMVDADGKQNGLFEVPTGGRRFRALELLGRSPIARRRLLRQSRGHHQTVPRQHL